MESPGELLPIEDDLRPEYDLTKLVRLPAVKVHFRRRPRLEPLDHGHLPESYVPI